MEVVLRSACGAPSWKLQQFAEPPEDRQIASRSTAQAAVVGVLWDYHNVPLELVNLHIVGAVHELKVFGTGKQVAVCVIGRRETPCYHLADMM